MKRKRSETRESKELETRRKKPRASRLKPLNWLRGRLCPKNNENSWFIKAMTELPEGYNRSKDVFMNPKYIPQFVLPVVEGDLLDFILGDRDKTRPMAIKVRVSQYSQRSCDELIEYMRKLMQDINSDNFNKVIVQILPCTALWIFLGSPVFQTLSDSEFAHVGYIEVFLNLLKQVLHHGKSYKNLLEEIIKTVTLGTMFQDRNSRSLPATINSCNYTNGRFCVEGQEKFLTVELVRSFCHDAISQVPSVTRCLLPTVSAINKKIASSSTQNFLFDLLSLNAMGEKASLANATTWKEAPLIPTDHELAGHLVEKDQHLQPVRTNVPYDNPEQYMDTYFRLVRAETFSAIQHGIKDLKASKLDLRDMNVYHNIHLAGFKFQGGRFSVAIHFTPIKKVKKWEASRQLMYGNLVCLSINRRFDDVIWATVSDRDAELLKQHQMIMLELLDENVKSISEIIYSLQTRAGSAVMVESPTYYHSLSPILRSLKEFDMENFPLQHEILCATPAFHLPGYLKNATFLNNLEYSPRKARSIMLKFHRNKQEEEKHSGSTFEPSKREDEKNSDAFATQSPVSDDSKKTLTSAVATSFGVDIKEEENSKSVMKTTLKETPSIVTSKLPGDIPNDVPQDRMEVECTSTVEKLKYIKELAILSTRLSLEASQREALVYALKNRLAVIQGPPGCGKTYLGVKIVQLLLSLKPKLQKPILLLTYKNHALDEFLKRTLRFCEKDDLVRIGGRSKEPELEPCNLRLVQNSISYDMENLVEIQNMSSEIANLESRIKPLCTNVEAGCYLTKESLIDKLTEDQIKSLIVDAGWGRGLIVYQLNSRCFADKSLVMRWLNDVSHNFGSIKEFIRNRNLSKFGVSENDNHGKHCMKIFDKAFKKWCPDRRELQRTKELQSEFILQMQRSTTANEDTPKAADDEDDDQGDEDDVKQLLEFRMASGAKQESCSTSDLILFNHTSETNKTDILVEISDYPPDMAVNSQILSVRNLWSLTNAQRLQFLYCILNETATRISQELNDLLELLQSLKNRKKELEMNDKVKLLSMKKVIGVTITGASINHDLLHHIGPSVVIVEEAAEILEPSLLAALTPSVEHLILIGDHEQLRPQVDTYDLRRNFRFDVSMMERLIRSGYPYKSLARQNRMRPEFSALLHDIYPNLQDNLLLVSRNVPLKCIAKSMFFWSHNDPEKEDRTFTNVKEAERVIALVLYLLSCGCRPSKITVLAAYLGQTKLLRKMIREEQANHPELFEEDFVQVQTIDMYQGDENNYVIISLVRSNEENNIGFLKSRNRRCVAQSRAKCGMYFVGNANTLREAKGSCWLHLITSMMKQNCVAIEIPLQCTKHETSVYKAVDGESVRYVIADRSRLCRKPCGDPCSQPEKHLCTKPCYQKHVHRDCSEKVADKFPDCGHPVERKCYEKVSWLRCEYKTTVELPCGHEGQKKCCEQVCDVVCRIPVTATFPRCGHQTEKLCCDKIEWMYCIHLCEETNSCGIHPCRKECGETHGHDRCQEFVRYNFPKCGHPSRRRKKCSEEITWKCRYKGYFTGACGHDIQKECYQSESEVKCQFVPCEKSRKCGHPCTNACGDDCEKGECKHCQRVHEKKMEEFHATARKRVGELDRKIREREIPNFCRGEIRAEGTSAAEYQKVKDQVEKFIKPCHRWFPKITKIEKVTNLDLEQKFERAKCRAFGDYIDTKFHGTSNKGVRDIARNGFRMPEANPRPPKKRGMFGQGIYFTTDSSKSAQEIYTKGSQKLLLCQVILGNSLTVDKADNTLNKEKLRSNHFDSVYAPRETAVMNDEFVIFDPDQALPQYIIHFSASNNVVPPSPSTLTQEPFTVQEMLPSRAVNFQDPFEMYYSFAESHFRRMAVKSNPPLLSHQATISSIDIVINKDLEQRFEATKEKFKSEGIPHNEVLAYHGTDQKNIDSILKSNLQLSYAKRQAHGKGNYFSEFPAVSLGYGDGLLLCRILPGKEFVDSSGNDIPSGYNSKKVLGSQPAGATAANASGKMIIIENSDQILPFFVIHR